MTLSDLLLSCQNQWLIGFKLNPLFTVKLVFEVESDLVNEKDYILNYNYCHDYNYLLKYRHRHVVYWTIFSINEILVKIEGSY